MSSVQPITDPTGVMTQEQLNAANINNLMQEFNKDQDSATANFQQNSYNLVINDGAVDRIIIGLLPDNTWGIVVSAPGVAVESLFS